MGRKTRFGRRIREALDERVLEQLFTSADAPIYGVRHQIPPEMWGALASFFSRNPKDFRAHTLDAIEGDIKGYESGFGTLKKLAIASGALNLDSALLRPGVEKAQSFFGKWYGTYSHKSIANTVWLPFVATNVSQLFARELAFQPLAFFIEQSTRYVHFSLDNVYKDPDVMDSPLADEYIRALDAATTNYNRMIALAKDHYEQLTPFAQWREEQPDSVLQRSQESQRRKYEREIRGQSLDIARFLLPQAIQTNLAWIVDARSQEFDIAAWKEHPLAEIRDSAQHIEAAGEQLAPSLLKYTAPNEYYGEKLRHYDGELPAPPSAPFEKGASVIHSEDDALDQVVAHILHNHNAGGTYEQRLGHVQARMDEQEKLAVLRRTTQNRGPIEEWPAKERAEVKEVLNLVPIGLEVRSDVGAIRDLRRHQKWERGEAEYSMDNGYYKPDFVADIGPEAERIFDETFEIAHDAWRALRGRFPHQAALVVPMGTNHSLTLSGGIDDLQYFVYTRSTPEANFSYREDAFNVAEAAVREHPWLLGLSEYPEGRSIRAVYADAPVKSLLGLRTEELGLHT